MHVNGNVPARRAPRRVALFALSILLAGSLSFLLAGSLSLPASAADRENAMLPPGLYRLEMIMATISRLPFFGTSKSASRSVSLVRITQEGDRLMQNHEVCDFTVLESSAVIRMVFPEKFIAALGRHTYPLDVVKDPEGWRYRADLGIERIGYKQSSGDSKLPSAIDDSSVYDWDGDGNPGATLKLSLPLLPDGELYIVQRGHSVLSGRITRPGRVEGAIEVRSFEHRVLGAKPGFLNRSPEIKPDPERSRFSLIPIPSNSDCDTLRGAARHAARESS